MALLRSSSKPTVSLHRNHRIILAAAAICLLSSVRIHADILLEDSFSYGDGPIVSTSDGVWTTHSGTSQQVLIQSGRAFVNGANSEDVGRNFGSLPDGTSLYAKFTVRVRDTPSSNAYFAHFGPLSGVGGFKARLFATTQGAGPNAFRFGIIQSSSPTSSFTLSSTDCYSGITYTVVLRIQLGNVVSKLWVSPTSELSPSIEFQDQIESNIQRFCLREATGMGSFDIDDLRVATTFDEALYGTTPPVITYGIDVSHFQNEQGPIDWNEVYRGGKRFVYIKASEGKNFPDGGRNSDHTRENYLGATGANPPLLTGVFHVACPNQDLGTSGATDEANYFLGRARGYIGSGSLPPALDLENRYVSNVSPTNLSIWVRKWLAEVAQATNCVPMIYTNRSIASILDSDLVGPQSIYPLWIATDDGDETGVPSWNGISFPQWKIKQYRFGEHPGTPGTSLGVTGHVDLDSFHGSLADLKAMTITAICPLPSNVNAITAANGTKVTGAAVLIDGQDAGVTDSDGTFWGWFCGSHDVQVVATHLSFSGPLNFVCGQSSTSSPTQTQTVELVSDVSCENVGPFGGLAVGDTAEVFSTGNGLRARYPDGCGDSWIVMQDGSRGTIVDGPQCCNGYFRWQIRYDDLPTILLWSAEGEPSTGQVFLRRIGDTPTPTPTLAPSPSPTITPTPTSTPTATPTPTSTPPNPPTRFYPTVSPAGNVSGFGFAFGTFYGYRMNAQNYPIRSVISSSLNQATAAEYSSLALSLEGGYNNGNANTPDGNYWVEFATAGSTGNPDYSSGTFYFLAWRQNGVWAEGTPIPLRIISMAKTFAGPISINGMGSPNRSLTVKASSVASGPFIPIQTISLDQNGTFSYQDLDAQNLSGRFYIFSY